MRAGPLSDSRVISLLNRAFVPVYTSNDDYQKNGAAPPEERAELQRIIRESLEAKLGTGDVHVFILGPDGRALDGLGIGSATQTPKLIAALERTAARLGTVSGGPVVQPAPQSAPPPAEPESLVLHVTSRGANRGSWREFPAENWLVLPRGRWTKLLPPGRVEPGLSWEIDPRVTGYLLTHFYPQAEDTHVHDLERNRIDRQSLRATVVAVEGAVARLRLEGSLRMKRPFYPGRDDANFVEVTVIGYAEVEPGAPRLRSLGLVTDQATYGAERFAVAVRSIGPAPRPPAPERLLFDFESDRDLRAWSAVPPAEGEAREPEPGLELAAAHAASGRRSLKVTFRGGTWPAVATTQVPDDWMPWQSFQAEVTVGRPCLVGFRAYQEKSSRRSGWDGAVSRWVKTELLLAGTSTVSGALHPNDWSAIRPELGPVRSLEILMYRPHAGESIHVDRIRLLPTRTEAPPVRQQFSVLGTDMVVSGVQELGQKLKEGWSKPAPRSVEQVEAEFRAAFAALRQAHPRAVMAVLREGERGFDPARPERVYAGWKDAYWSSHGPDGMTEDRARNTGRDSGHELFMRHRSPLMRVDLASIPRGAAILAAKLVVVRASPEYDKERNPEANPNMWVAEPCSRPWDEYEVNAYQYARDRFWRAIGGTYYGEDPDFLPLYIAHGPGGGQVSAWDFREAVQLWTSGGQPNHGFMLHCDAFDWMMRAHSRESPDIRNRPALLVAYEPPG